MRKILLSSISVLALASAASAEDAIETVVVTATRTPQPADVTGESIDVITSKDLEEQQIDVTSDALAELPGVNVIRDGALGQPTSVSIRGAESGQTVVLLDGVRINDPSATDDGAVLGDLLVNNVDRIEVLSGPQSTLYGNDAISGVVNVITKLGGPDPFGLVVTAEGGALDTAHLNLAATGTYDNVDYGAGVNYLYSRSVSTADSRNGNTEADPYQNFGATLNTRIHVNSDLSIDLRGTYINGHASFDDGFASIAAPPFGEVSDSRAYNQDELYVGYAGVNYDLFGGMFRNRFGVTATASSRLFYNSAFDLPSELNFADYGQSLGLEYQAIVDPTDVDEITFGAETLRSGFRSNDFFAGSLTESDTGNARISGYYLQAQHRFFDQLTLTGGVRLDDDSEFGTHTSLKIAAAWQIPGWDATLHANYGDGFKAPSLFEDFSVFAPPPGQPALRPESANGWEVAFEKSLLDGRLVGSVTYFARDTSNLINFFDCFTPTTGPGCATKYLVGGYYFNEGRTRSSGVTAELSAQVTDTINLTANYTDVAATVVDTGLPLARTPHVTANGTITWAATADLSFGGSVTYVGPRFDDAAATVPLTGLALFNLFGSYKLDDQTEFFARIENLANAHYEPVFGYGAPARTAYAGIRLRL